MIFLHSLIEPMIKILFCQSFSLIELDKLCSYICNSYSSSNLWYIKNTILTVFCFNHVGQVNVIIVHYCIKVHQNYPQNSASGLMKSCNMTTLAFCSAALPGNRMLECHNANPKRHTFFHCFRDISDQLNCFCIVIN